MKVLGSVKNVAKKPKEDLIKAYEKMYEAGAFKVDSWKFFQLLLQKF